MLHLKNPLVARRTAVLALALLLQVTGCVHEADGGDPMDPEWLAFRDSARVHADGYEFFRVEWDLGFQSEHELWEYYRVSVGAESRATGVVGRHQESLIVNTVVGSDDVWGQEDAVALTYCVSTSFGSLHSRVVAEMHEATSAWMSVANVRFIYVEDEDSSCSAENPNVVIPLRPWALGGACAFFPSGGGCIPNTLIMDYWDFDYNPDWAQRAPNMTTAGVLRHELGHVLGFRHEHARPEAGNCNNENASWRALTPYDVASVMHYQWCGGVLSSDLSLTPADQIGAIQVYGVSSALMTASVI